MRDILMKVGRGTYVLMVIALLFAVEVANAQGTPTTEFRYKHEGGGCGATTSPPSDPTFTSAEAACEAMSYAARLLNAKQFIGSCSNTAAQVAYTSTGPGIGQGSCLGTITVGPQVYTNTAIGTWTRVSVQVCPGNVAPVNGTCPSPTGCTEADLGTQNFTVGWSPTPPGVLSGAAINALPDSSFYPTGCLNNCAIDTGGSQASRCWHSTKATSNGLYRLSCDFATKRRAQACTASTSDPSSPTSPSPPCPGSVGVVNGKTVCLNVPNQSQLQLPKPGYGNPRAGTAPSQSNNTREPSTEQGGGPDNRGGPSVTDGPDGSRGTGSNRIPGADTTNPDAPDGPDLELPTDYARDATVSALGSKLDAIKSGQCGGPNQPKCETKLDETGTPDGNNTDTEAKAALDIETGKLTTKLDEIVAGNGAPDRGWGFNISFPTTCVPIPITTNRWGNFSLNFCQWQPIIHDIMGLIWASTTLFLCIGMTFRTINTA